MKNLSKIVCMVLALCFAFSMILSGCGESKATDSNTASSASAASAASVAATTVAASTNEQKEALKECTIKFFTYSSVNKTELDLALDDFYKKFPMIKVEPVVIVDYENFPAKVKTSVVAGEQVDVIEVGTINIERASPDALYTPLDDLAKKNNLDIAKEYGDYAKQLTINGKLYGIPKMLTPDGIWYNKKHFEEAKIAEPAPDWTMDEFFAIAKQLTQKDASGKVTRWGGFSMNFANNNLANTVLSLAVYGGYQLLKDDGSPNMDDPKLKKAIEYYYNATMVDKSLPSIGDINAEKLQYAYDMYKGRYSMSIGGRNTAMFMDIHKLNGQLTAEDDDANIYKLAYMPRWDKDQPAKQSVDTVIGYALSKTTKYQSESLEFIKWYTTTCLELAAKVAHRLPASRTVDTSVLMDSWTYYKNSKTNEIVKGKDRTDLFKIMLDPEIKPIYSENTYKYSYSGLMINELEKQMSLLFSGNITVDNAIAAAKTEIMKIYEKEKSK